MAAIVPAVRSDNPASGLFFSPLFKLNVAAWIQADFLDPTGRSVKLSLRKLFQSRPTRALFGCPDQPSQRIGAKRPPPDCSFRPKADVRLACLLKKSGCLAVQFGKSTEVCPQARIT